MAWCKAPPTRDVDLDLHADICGNTSAKSVTTVAKDAWAACTTVAKKTPRYNATKYCASHTSNEGASLANAFAGEGSKPSA